MYHKYGFYSSSFYLSLFSDLVFNHRKRLVCTFIFQVFYTHLHCSLCVFSSFNFYLAFFCSKAFQWKLILYCKEGECQTVHIIDQAVFSILRSLFFHVANMWNARRIMEFVMLLFFSAVTHNGWTLCGFSWWCNYWKEAFATWYWIMILSA